MTYNIKNARQIMEQLYLDRNRTGDITFVVESQPIRAHRNVLAAQSPKYNAQFYGPSKAVGEIRVPNVSAAAFNVFLQFFYKRTIDLTMENIAAVLDLAKRSLVDEFVESCGNFLKNEIRLNNLCIAYRLATLYDIGSLRFDCERRIAANSLNFFGSEDFLQCDCDMLSNILKLDTLNCSGTDVFRACIAWARAHCKRNSLDERNPENLRAALGDVIHQIRFTSFSSEEFVDVHNWFEGFFTTDEVDEILCMTEKLKDFKSSKFNISPRTSRIEQKDDLKVCAEPPVVGTLEFDRIVRKNPVPFSIHVKGKFFIIFHCDDPIRLYGFTLGMHLNKFHLDGFPKIFAYEAICDNGPKTPFKTKYKAFQSPTNNDETVIEFEKPIEKVTFFSCSFYKPPIQLNYKLELHTIGQVDNIYFTFEGSKWVTRLFFDKYET